MGQLETLAGNNNDGRLSIMLQTFSLVGIHQSSRFMIFICLERFRRICPTRLWSVFRGAC